VVDDVEFVEVVMMYGKQKRKAYKHNWKVILKEIGFGSEDS